MSVLILIRGPKVLSQELVELLEKEQYRVINQLPDKDEEGLPVIKDGKVFREGGRFGGLQLKQKLAEFDLVYIRTKSNPLHELAIRRVRGKAGDVIHIVMGMKGKFQYAAINSLDFSADLMTSSAGPTALAKVGNLLSRIADRKVASLDYIPTDANWNYADTARKLGWDWRFSS